MPARLVGNISRVESIVGIPCTYITDFAGFLSSMNVMVDLLLLLQTSVGDKGLKLGESRRQEGENKQKGMLQKTYFIGEGSLSMLEPSCENINHLMKG